MLVFVTGAAGFIGRSTVQELIKHGHQVLGLSRNEANTEILKSLGAQVHHGDLNDLESLTAGAKAADGVIHLAFHHDFSDIQKMLSMDMAAVGAIADGLAGTGKPLVIASGTMLAKKGELAAEDCDVEHGSPFALRQQTADLVVKLSKEKNIRGSVVRLTPTVHDKEDKGLIPMFGDLFKKVGSVTIIGDGANRWPAVHRLDAAVIFRLALEKGTPGAVYHAVAEQGVPIKDIMAVVGRKLQLPVEGKTIQEAMGGIGPLAMLIGADNPASSDRTQKELGWNPRGSGSLDLLADLEANYFN